MMNKGVDTGASYSPEALLSRIRNMNRQQMVTAGVVGAEVLGFFTVGEMLGRMKLVGYTGDQEHHETATNTH
jgi:F-type H+-transporting ATPase subunit g